MCSNGAVDRYFRFSTLSEAKFRHLIRCFALDFTATQTAHLTGISLRSVNAIFLRVRPRIAAECEPQSPLDGVLEADESYFEAQRVRGRCGRGVGGKTIVSGLLKRGDSMYTAIVPTASESALQRSFLAGPASVPSSIPMAGRGTAVSSVWASTSTSWRAQGNIFAQQLNDVRSFWSLAKRRLARFCVCPGVPSTFTLKRQNFASMLQSQPPKPLQRTAKLPQKGPALSFAS